MTPRPHTTTRPLTAQAPPAVSTALPIAADPTPTSAAERALVRRIAASGNFDELVTHLPPEAERTSAILTAALAWVALGQGRMSYNRLPLTEPWYAALHAALGKKTWTATMDAWVSEHARAALPMDPAILRRTAQQWAQRFTTPALLQRALPAALHSPHRAWLHALLRSAPAWTPATLQQLLDAVPQITTSRCDPLRRLVGPLLTNPHISPDAWRAIEAALAFQHAVEYSQDWMATHLLPTLWSSVGASPETQQRALSILQSATAPQIFPHVLPYHTELCALIAGGHLPWSACAPWAARVRSSAVMHLLLHHPDLPGAVAVPWLSRPTEHRALLRAAGAHPTLGAHAGVRRLLWPHLRLSLDIPALFLRYGTAGEALAAFEVLAARAPHRALTLLAQHRPSTVLALSPDLLHRLLAHRDTRVRLAAIASLGVLRHDPTGVSAVPLVSPAPTPPTTRR